ncbi:odorant receptor 13a-like isoform X2 [Linepithema humile]|uniref:odorant receptor 13a-like isoform X2 n=1 Tax=Linepithema humile TaxID=83485 RepID=UPI00351E1BB9
MTTLFDTRYYRVTKFFASLVGIWPYLSQFRRTFQQSLSVLIMLTFFPAQIKKLYDVWGVDLDIMCTCIAPMIAILVSMAKVITSAVFQPQIEMLLRQIEMDWEIDPEGEEHKILVEYTLRTRTLSIFYTTMLCNGILSYMLTPVIVPIMDIIAPKNETREKHLAFEVEYFGLDQQTYWVWLWLHNNTTLVTCVLNIVGADLMYVMFILHACYLFVCVRHKLESTANTIEQTFENLIMQPFENCNYNSKYAYEDEPWQLKLKKSVAIIKKCAINHQKAIECVQVLQNIYRWSFLGILGLNLIVLSFSAVQLVSRLGNWQLVMMSFMFISGTLTHLFFLSLMAQFILDQSSNIYKSTYACCWYALPLNSQQDVMLILIRSHTPCRIMAGKMFVMSLQNFSSIVQSAMSYFTVLASFR